MALTAILICAASFAQNSNSIYNKYSDKENVSAVYISSAMFRMMGKLPDIDVPGEDMNLAPIVKDMKGMYVLDSENKSVNKELRADVEKFLSGKSYEILLEAKEDGELVRIFTLGDEKTVHSFVVTSHDKDEYVFICLDGTIKREDLEMLIASSIR